MMKAIVLSRSSDLAEIRSLLKTLGIEIIKEHVQKKNPHPSSYLGPGKIEEILSDAEHDAADIIVINDMLKPSQHHFLEMKFERECLDRIGVILRIFAEHAHTPEAIAQVQLARLRYEQPFLREWIHKAKSGERPGFLAGGAYATDVYYEHAKTHIRRIEKRLRELSKARETRRVKRHEQGFTLVALAGYTNAGKSALMNALCATEIEVSSQLFSSLSTTTRRIKGIRGTVLMIDTVGFIKDLPTNLIDAFKSTLEEIFFADMILLVFDAGEDDEVIKSKIMTSLEILTPEIEPRRIVVVGTKIDLIDQDRCTHIEKMARLLLGTEEVYLLSALSETGLDGLRDRISSAQNRTYALSAELPLTDTSYRLISRLHEIADVKHDMTDGLLTVRLMCNPLDVERIRNWLIAAGARTSS